MRACKLFWVCPSFFVTMTGWVTGGSKSRAVMQRWRSPVTRPSLRPNRFRLIDFVARTMVSFSLKTFQFSEFKLKNVWIFLENQKSLLLANGSICSGQVWTFHICESRLKKSQRSSHTQFWLLLQADNCGWFKRLHLLHAGHMKPARAITTIIGMITVCQRLAAIANLQPFKRQRSLWPVIVSNSFAYDYTRRGTQNRTAGGIGILFSRWFKSWWFEFWKSKNLNVCC